MRKRPNGSRNLRNKGNASSNILRPAMFSGLGMPRDFSYHKVNIAKHERYRKDANRGDQDACVGRDVRKRGQGVSKIDL
jgi:hypothetical protein